MGRSLKVACACFLMAVCLVAADVMCSTPAARRAEVIQAIGRGPAGFPVLKKALNDEDLIVRRTAARGLVQMGEPAEAVLAEALGNDDFEVRRMALIALNDMGKLETARLFAMLSDENEVVRQTAGELLNILKRWDFMPDVSRDEYAPVLRLRGETQLVGDGPSGISIESFPGHPLNVDEEVKAHGAWVSNHPALSPEGAFTIEMWIKPSPEWLRGEGDFARYRTGYLVDKKYIHNTHRNPAAENHNDYMITMRRVRNDWRFDAWLGFGEESDSFNSYRIGLEPGKWHHFAFTYDGEGEGKYYLDGENIGGTVREGREGITHGGRRLQIGDRLGSHHRGFPGLIDSVRIHHRVIDVKPSGTD